MDLSDGVTVRSATPGDFDPIVAVVDDWWGRPISHNLSRLFLDHFAGTSLVAELDGTLVGFLIGFLSPDQPTHAYVHFVGVNPESRRTGLARHLYELFFDIARAGHRTVVHAITAPVNTRSIAFHSALGFECSAPVADYDGPGVDRVVFTRQL
jgi:predicted GNAT superfamily acetyltransferase